MLRALNADQRVVRLDFIPSEAALRVFAEEMHLSGRNALVEKLLGAPPTSNKIASTQRPTSAANVASGSYPSDGMIVLPCSMGTLAGIANGMASNLIDAPPMSASRSVDRLILCVRETPFNRIHLRNMQLADEAGATIFPSCPPSTTCRATPPRWRASSSTVCSTHIGLPQPGA